jgi:hypothetical protein
MDQPQLFNSALERLLKAYVQPGQRTAEAGPAAHDQPTMHYAPDGPTVQAVQEVEAPGADGTAAAAAAAVGADARQ